MPGEKPRTQWSRVMVEGAVIVVSILMAFGIDAAWENRGEAARREGLLIGLASDFEVAEENLNATFAYHLEAMAACARILELTALGEVNPHLAPEVDTLLTAVFLGSEINPPTGALDALLSSGDLRLLEDDELVAALTAWPSLVGDIRPKEVELERDLAKLIDYLIAQGIRTNDLIWSGAVGYDFSIPWDPEHTNAYQLIPEAEFESRIGEIWFRYNNTTHQHKALKEALGEIRSLLSRTLSDSASR